MPTDTDLLSDAQAPTYDEESVEGDVGTDPSFVRAVNLLNRVRSMLRGNGAGDTGMETPRSGAFMIRISSNMPSLMSFRTSVFSSDDEEGRDEPLVPSLFGGFGSPFAPGSLFDRLNGIMDQHMNEMMSRIRQRPFYLYPTEDEEVEETQEEEEEQLVPRFREEFPVPISSPTNADLGDELDDSEDRVDELEDLKSIDDDGFLVADWGVNVANMREACMDAFQDVCPESVPAVFYGDIHRFPPLDTPHVGLAPEDPEAPCYMKCADEHQDELPYECQVAVERMEAWIERNGDDVVFVESPGWFLFTSLLHFLIMILLIATCVRCTCLFIKLRRERTRHRRAVLLEKDEKNAAVPVVKAITIQVPPREDMSDEKIAALVQAQVVA